MKDLNILAETSDFLAVNKPSGMLSIPDRHDDTLISAVKLLKRNHDDVFVVHRLDRLTSGILLFAKNASAHRYFSLLFEKREIEKIYTGIVTGKMTDTSGRIEAPIAENPFRKGEMMVHKKGKESITEFELKEAFDSFSVVDFKLLTGRTHQIRVHARYINHPLACDPVYGDGKPVFLSAFKRNFRLGKAAADERPLLDRLGLHAASLSFTGPDKKHYHLEAPLPKDMKAVIQQLRKIG